MSDARGLTTHEVRYRAIRGALAVTARGFLVRVLGFAGTVVVARLLTPHDLGIVAIGFALITVIHSLADMGLASAFIRRLESPVRLELEAMLGLYLTVSIVVS